MHVFDVATYFLNLSLNDSRPNTKISHLKLQKLVYYAQAWHLAALGKSLFNERIEAWPHGPVSPELYQEYKEYGYQSIPHFYRDVRFENDLSKQIVEMVWSFYGSYDAKELEKLTHSEDPWKNARKGLSSWQASNREITKGSIESYFKKYAITGV